MYAVFILSLKILSFYLIIIILSYHYLIILSYHFIIEKRVVDFLLLITELFRCYG